MQIESDGDVRLINNDGVVVGDDPYYGYVEVYYQGHWGTVCNDGVNVPPGGDCQMCTGIPDNNNMIFEVICTQLGYTNVIEYNRCQNSYDTSCKPWGYGRGDILDQVFCIGGELNLLACSHNAWNVHDCAHHEDIGVKCGGFV